jgi:hypothetical protein
MSRNEPQEKMFPKPLIPIQKQQQMLPKSFIPIQKKTNQKFVSTKTQSPNLEVQTMDLQMNLKNKCFQNHLYNSKPIKKRKKTPIGKNKILGF